MRRSTIGAPSPAIRPPPAARDRNVLAPLRNMHIIKPVLPLEIIATILDHLPVSDLVRCARVSRRLQEMVYDDSRWVARLVYMGVWDEVEARRRIDEVLKRRKALAEARALLAGDVRGGGAALGGKGRGVGGGAGMVFDAREEERRKEVARRLVEEDEKRKMELLGKRKGGTINLEDELEMLNLGSSQYDLSPSKLRDPVYALNVLDRKAIRSIRGLARYEYGRIYGALAPFYFDLAKARSHADPVVFRVYRDPKLQAKMLNQLKVFAESDTSFGWRERKERLESMMGIFENAALREFEGGYEAGDVEGRMKRYADVLITLNGGAAAVQLFVQKHPILIDRESLGNPMEAFKSEQFSIKPAQEFLSRLKGVLDEQADVISRIFPPTTKVYLPLLERISEDVLTEYFTPLLDELHDRDIETYLKAMAELWVNTQQFVNELKMVQYESEKEGEGEGKEKEDDREEEERQKLREEARKVINHVFETHVDLYLQEEIDHFKKKCEEEVNAWEKKIADEDAATESYFMSTVNREADKRDFLSTFKKVILMPVNAIPLPNLMATKPTPTNTTTTPSRMNEDTSYFGAAGDRNSLAVPNASPPGTIPSDTSTAPIDGRISPGPQPTTELAAKTAILNSRLEGIKSLFSLEVALNLVHEAKTSLERAALFTALGGQTGEEAREQCENIFVSLVSILGTRHVKAGFDKAVQHLSEYNPAAHAGGGAQASIGVAPLVTFLELVNVGDLIQQMLDVFYEQELVAKRLTDRTDFLNPSTNEKRKFEQMLDERVAAGLNRGIDVLIDEVDYIFATYQSPTDFNPGAATTPGVQGVPEAPGTMPGEPTKCAQRIVQVVESHTRLLTGTTDKHLLDVFNTELGQRLFASLQKHIKRQRISTAGAPTLISDINTYASLVARLKITALLPYFNAMREVAQIYLIDARDAKSIAEVIADGNRFKGVWRTEEVYEFAARREDWFRVRKEVEKAMYGFGCLVM